MTENLGVATLAQMDIFYTEPHPQIMRDLFINSSSKHSRKVRTSSASIVWGIQMCVTHAHAFFTAADVQKVSNLSVCGHAL